MRGGRECRLLPSSNCGKIPCKVEEYILKKTTASMCSDFQILVETLLFKISLVKF